MVRRPLLQIQDSLAMHAYINQPRKWKSTPSLKDLCLHILDPHATSPLCPGPRLTMQDVLTIRRFAGNVLQHLSKTTNHPMEGTLRFDYVLNDELLRILADISRQFLKPDEVKRIHFKILDRDWHMVEYSVS